LSPPALRKQQDHLCAPRDADFLVIDSSVLFSSVLHGSSIPMLAPAAASAIRDGLSAISFGYFTAVSVA
jgi:hypothetical protein